MKISSSEPKTISGHVLINGLNGIPRTSEEIQFDLLKLQVSEVTYGNQQLEFFQNDSILTVKLAKNVDPISTPIKIVYSGQPVADAKWGGFYFTGNYSFNMGVGFASNPHNFGRCWFPCNDNFTNRSSYEFNIETDSGYSAICSGEFLGVQNNVWSWRSDLIPTYLASVAVGKYVMVKDEFQSKDRMIPIILASEAKDTSNFKASFTHLKQAITCFEEKFNPYKFLRVGFVGVPFNSGAMEHAANIAYPLYAINGNTDYET
ncbi:MAG: hypothetical protein ACOVP1_02015, partial [Bacteroidia bacterium]